LIFNHFLAHLFYIAGI